MDAVKSRLSRRTIVTGLAVGAAGAGAAAFGAIGRTFLTPADAGEGNWWSGPGIDLKRAGISTWRRRIGNSFVVDSDAGSATYTLARVDAFPSPGERPDDVTRDVAFALVFEGDRRVDGNRIYNVRHNGGAFDIFFSPSDPSAERPILQAVFN
jgi:hypothetical protein